MPKYSGEEKRKFPRLAASYMIKYRELAQASGFDITSTRNISQGGVTITTAAKLEAGSLLELTLRLPFAADEVHVKAEVVACQETVKGSVWETRIKFVDMPEDYAKKIDEFIGRRVQSK